MPDQGVEWWLAVGTAILAFLGGLLGPALKNLVDTLVASKISDRERLRRLGDDRARVAAEACYEELEHIRTLIPKLRAWDVRTSTAKSTQENWDQLKAVQSEHSAALARLEANVVLLSAPARAEMEYVLALLRIAHELPYNKHAGTQLDAGWHPDSASVIATNLVGHGREVLASYLTSAPLPERPESVQEYKLASEDRNEDVLDFFQDQADENAEALRVWRTNHDLPPDRTHTSM